MTAQKIAASQTATQRKHTGRLARHFKLSVLAGLSAGTKEKRLQAVSANAPFWICSKARGSPFWLQIHCRDIDTLVTLMLLAVG